MQCPWHRPSLTSQGNGTFVLPLRLATNFNLGVVGGAGTVACHVTILGSDGNHGNYITEAPIIASVVFKTAGMDPFIEPLCNPGQILHHLYVKNIFLAQILAELDHFHWQPS